MLNPVLELLAARGWFDVTRPFEKTINFTRGACLWMLLTRGGASDTYVKFSDCMDLTREAWRCAEASRCHGGLVPRFVGHARHEGLDVLVCRAVDYRGLNAQRLERGPERQRVFDGLAGYFAAQPGTRLPDELAPMPNARLPSQLGAYFAAHETGRLAERWLAGDAARLAAQLPDQPQHGDLVLNNLGLLADGSLTVFDWEDFGACCLPGLDLFTLELALAGQVGAFYAQRGQPAHPTQVFVRRVCSAIGLEPDDYTALTPVYALAFRYLKRNYGPDVRARMDQLLLDIERRQSLLP